MTVTINGTTGVAGVDGTAATPAIQGNDTNTGIFFPAADTIAFAEGGAEVARFDNAGKLLVGTSTTPASGEVRQILATGGAVFVELQNTSTNSGCTIGTASGDMRFFTNTGAVGSESYTERMRIDSNGVLLIGTTDSGFNSKVVVKSPASWISNNYRSDSVTATGTGWNHFYGTSNSNSVANIIIYGNGNIQNANNSYGSLSDSKLKENIVDATPKLDKLMQVKVRNYNLKGDYEKFKQIGVIAQELETVFPSLIEETADKDAEGNDLGTTTKAVKYSVFVPMLIKAIQEQQAIITDLKSRIEALEQA
jgi:hypothetical protein